MGAALQVVGETRPDRKPWKEFCRLVFTSQGQGAFGLRGASRQRSAHSTESREVLYPWHPWHGRVVLIHESFTRSGLAVFRCSSEENLEARHLEIPKWMFIQHSAAECASATVPTVSGEALLDLKSLLQGVPLPLTEVVLQAQHRSLLPTGSADAKVT